MTDAMLKRKLEIAMELLCKMQAQKDGVVEGMAVRLYRPGFMVMIAQLLDSELLASSPAGLRMRDSER